MPATPGHVAYLSDLIETLNKAGSSISCCLLAYTLAPQAVYPTQIVQAASLINYLFQTESRSPSDLILAGDSAGGNLLAGLLSHILHPHPGVQAIDLNSTAFRAALFLSPWVSFDTSHPSYARNAQSDMFDHVPLETWSSAFLGSNKRQGIRMGDSYSEPLIAEPSWWNGVHKVVSQVMIWGGGGEILIDGIKAFAEKFSEGWTSGGGAPGNVRVIIEDKMCHEEMVVDVILGYKVKGKGARDVEDFVRSKL